MTTYAVTGASGQLGRLVIDQLLEQGVAPGDVVALARTPEKVADLAERGVQVREADYDRPETLAPALEGVDQLLLISANEVGKRLPQHTNTIEAAKTSGVSRIAYTSLLRADSSPLALAPEHQATEVLLAASGRPHTVLRNGWYIENFTPQVPTYVVTGTVLHAAGDGSAPFTYAQLADAVTEATGTPVSAKAVTGPELVGALTGAGLDEGTAGFFAGVDTDIAEGALDTDSTDLARLIGREPTSLVDAVRAAA